MFKIFKFCDIIALLSTWNTVQNHEAVWNETFLFINLISFLTIPYKKICFKVIICSYFVLQVVLGGEKHPIGDLYFRPTILTHLKPDMAAFKEEIFGPVISVIKFKTEEEALELANSTRVGLAGYFFSNDVRQCWRVAKKMEANIIFAFLSATKPSLQSLKCFTIFLSQLT